MTPIKGLNGRTHFLTVNPSELVYWKNQETAQYYPLNLLVLDQAVAENAEVSFDFGEYSVHLQPWRGYQMPFEKNQPPDYPGDTIWIQVVPDVEGSDLIAVSGEELRAEIARVLGLEYIRDR